ncbi:hypothetical protein NUW54_g2416 [Trametes sanguinea]|uniref:Uncharacterized protein n=1 Tax=Trametes sanguinea TaxID=158606 RepID=A0ACC1Q5X4_9APHY|nr:hypothetical protein NUW54_g2416 [Trametes sanguinea]
MFNPEYPAFPVVALLAAILAMIPLPWHFQAWNSGTCLFMAWSFTGCLNLAVNAIVWHADAIDRAPVWCDISSRIIVAVGVGIPASSLCINRRLYKIASVRCVSMTRAEKRRACLVDIAIALGIPLLQLVAYFIVSGHRYDIYEQIGCYPYIYNTPLAFPLVYVWPIVIGLCSAVYCILSLRAFAMRRAQFNEFLAASSSLTIARYFRLMALSTIELLCTTPIAVYGLYLNSISPIYRWISFADTHFGYSRVDQVSAVFWRTSHTAIITFELGRWSTVFCALVFFVLFGFADEARRNYRKVYFPIHAVWRRGFCSKSVSPSSRLDSKPTSPMTSASAGSLTVFTPAKASSMKELHSFSSNHVEFPVSLSPPLSPASTLL